MQHTASHCSGCRRTSRICGTRATAQADDPKHARVHNAQYHALHVKAARQAARTHCATHPLSYCRRMARALCSIAPLSAKPASAVLPRSSSPAPTACGAKDPDDSQPTAARVAGRETSNATATKQSSMAGQRAPMRAMLDRHKEPGAGAVCRCPAQMYKSIEHTDARNPKRKQLRERAHFQRGFQARVGLRGT